MNTSNLEPGNFGRSNIGLLKKIISYDFLSNLGQLIKLSLFHKYSTIIRLFIISIINIDSIYDILLLSELGISKWVIVEALLLVDTITLYIYIYNINNIRLSVVTYFRSYIAYTYIKIYDHVSEVLIPLTDTFN